MKFDRIGYGLHATPLLRALDAHPALWEAITIRQAYPGSAHHDTECIFARGPNAFTVDDYMFSLSAQDYALPPDVREAVDQLMLPVLTAIDVQQLGRVLIVRLAAGGSVDEHIDEGTYAEHYSRFHIPLRADHGSVLTVGGESVSMQSGEAWWFDHRQPHSARNDSGTERIHLIFDAVTSAYPTPRKDHAHGDPV